MARCRTYTVEFKRRVVEEHPGAGTSLNQLARRHDISREPLRICVRKYEAGASADDGPSKADRRAYEARTAGLERKVGQLTMELDLLKKGLTSGRCRHQKCPGSAGRPRKNGLGGGAEA